MDSQENMPYDGRQRAPDSGLKDMTVLFVDDEQETLDSLRRNLFREPYRKFFAASGGEGLEIIDRENVHVVVSDIQMPGMDGFAFLKEVRKRRPDIVRMVLSGTGNLDRVVELINTGEIYRYVTKPVHMVKELRSILHQALELHQIKSQRWRLMRELEERNSELRQWQAKMQRELSTAGAMQRKLLSVHPFFHERLEIFTAYEPHISIGGDFFDVLRLPGDRVCLFIGDVAGHGVAPAMISVLLKVLVEETVYGMFEQGPAAVCNAVHQRFLQHVRNPESYATMFMAIYNPDDSSWQCMNCGHPSPILSPAGHGFDLDRGGLPVGLSVAPDRICRREDELRIPASPGLSLLLYTDGLSEARGPASDMVCDGAGVAAATYQGLSAAAFNPARTILDQVQARGCDVSKDDCSVMVVQMIEPRTVLWSGDLPRDKSVVEQRGLEVRNMLVERGWPQPSAWAVRMVVHEYALNIIDHARLPANGLFRLSIRVVNGLCRILFLDAGREWDYPARKAMMEHRPVDSERGRGLELLASLCRDMLVFRRGAINHALFTVPETQS